MIKTHKDKKASRKNRAWSKSGKAAILKENFGPKDFEKYYTMIAAMDIKIYIYIYIYVYHIYCSIYM